MTEVSIFTKNIILKFHHFTYFNIQCFAFPNWQGQDPFRKSHLDVDKWVARGFDRDLSKQYVESILTNLISKNVVIEARFPKAGEIMSVLDKEVNEYLVGARNSFTIETDENIKHKSG